MNKCYLVLTIVGICVIGGCRSVSTNERRNSDAFICFQDIGVSNYRVPPFAICIDNPSQYFEQRAIPTDSYVISKYLVDLDSAFLTTCKISPEDFREIEAPASEFVSNAGEQKFAAQEYGAVRVTIVFESKVQSKNLRRQDYKLLLNEIPVGVLERNPKLANELRSFEKIPPLRMDLLQPGVK